MSKALDEAIREIVRQELVRAGVKVSELGAADDDEDIQRRVVERAAAMRRARGGR